VLGVASFYWTFGSVHGLLLIKNFSFITFVCDQRSSSTRALVEPGWGPEIICIMGKNFSNNIFMNLTSIFTSSLRHERGTEYTCRGGHKTNVSLRLHSYKFLGRYVLRLSLEHPYFSLTIPLRSPSYKQYSSHTRKRSVTYLNALKPQLIVFIRLVGG